MNTPAPQLERYIEKLVREFGDTLMTRLRDPLTEDIVLNPDGKLWVKSVGKSFQMFGTMPASQALSALGTLAAIKGTVIHHDQPVLETDLPIDGSRFQALIPPVVSSPVFAIRCRPKKVFTLNDYESAKILSDKDDPLNTPRERDDFLQRVRGLSHREVIQRAVAAKKNILIVGSTGSGKTTMVNAVLHELSCTAPDERVLLIEDTTELQCTVVNHVALLAVGRVTMLDCLRSCMRLKPDRIVVGEVRGAEAHTMLKAWNTGHPGGAATVHANDAVSGLRRLESLVAEATSAPQQALISEAVDVVIFIDAEKSSKAGRKVREVIVVLGYEDGKYLFERV
jgi:type IV secretion system protein VirB11